MTLTESEVKADRLKSLRRWFAMLETYVRNVRGSFAPDDPEKDTRRLSQKLVIVLLRKATELFWGESAADRGVLLPVYFKTLCALKLAADDVFVEARELSLEQPAASGSSAPSATSLDAKARQRYRTAITLFLRGHPFLVLDPTQRSISLYPVRSESVERSALQALPIGLIRLFPQGLTEPKTDFLVARASKRVRKIEANLAKIVGTTTKDFDLTPEAEHTLGAYFLLLQLFLSDLREEGGKPLFPADYWYTAAADAVTELRERVLGLHSGLERRALEAGNTALVAALRASGEAAIDRILRLYSVRIEETTAVWAFRTRRVLKPKDVFLQGRLLVGANDVREILTSYLGRGNPDGDSPEGMDVAHLLKERANLAGETVTVLGQFRPTPPSLESLSTKDRIDLIAEGKELLFASKSPGAAVEVEGVLDVSQGSPALVVKRINWFAQAYLTSVGSPMPVAGNPPRLDLTPQWRRPTGSLERAAVQDRELYNLPDALRGQERLFLDLMGVPGVLRAMRRKAGKGKASVTSQSLHDHDLRGEAWKTLFAALHKEDPDTALRLLVEHLQRYLKHFTRHTLWNVRDKGNPYYSTVWPRSIGGETLFDCGVYTVLLAVDFYRAMTGAAKQPMRFGYVTVLNHITLVVFVGDKTIFLNNRRLSGPEDVPAKDGKNSASRAEFALRKWGPSVFADTYNVKYGVALVRVPHETVSSAVGEGTFKKNLWTSYMRYAGWWGLQPGRADTYHGNIKAFNVGMLGVEKLLAQTPVTASPSSDPMLKMSQDTKLLFGFAGQLAHPDNFGERNGFKGKVPFTSAIGIVHPPGREPPIYEIVRRLAAAKKAGKALTPEQDALAGGPVTVNDHATLLNKIGSP